MAFEVNYLIESFETYFRQDEMSVLFFYAKDIDLELTQKMNYVLDKEIYYRIHHDQNTSGLDSNDAMYSYFNTKDIEAVILFISSQLIPAMKNEKVKMNEKYRTSNNGLLHLINNWNHNTLELYIAHDYVPVEMCNYIDMAHEMKELLQKSLALHTPLIISYTD